MIFLVEVNLPSALGARYVVVAPTVIDARSLLQKERPLAADLKVSVLGIESDPTPRVVCAEE